ncbi:OmpA family protein [Paucibacter sp. R3-3]|uniref:OmpA family protein n=1 Tax=Roseateles agri TaxID=3098619 RepID=A0ABU5DHV7_9BURK|nr:OmpA family protein [Paucibacter sp. R3-3]MDY0745879.1 OmpA family protein [Paucibacter sp. R3-3]
MKCNSILMALLTSACLAALPARAADEAAAVDLKDAVPQVKDIQDGLFPDDECEQLKAAGFKCMGFKAAQRYSLPAATFKAGSADLPDSVKRQLDVFAEALKGRSGTSQKVRLEGHTDASGSATGNQELSQRRAEAARQYLVDKGVSPDLLTAVGVGSSQPKPGLSPQAPENRRVEISRDSQPGAR